MGEMESMKTVSIAIVGAGSRGSIYADYALEHPDLAKVVAVAEPRDAWRERLMQRHRIPATDAVADWRMLLERPRLADAIVIATQDAMHVEPAVSAAAKGYAILLEKPMAPTARDCRRIVSALSADTLFGVCHVLRYTQHTRKLKELIDAGVIGDVVNVQSLEPVGYWHQAHSFVRGNWRRADESSPMILAKCCHDLDWIRYIVGSRCTAVQSFGSLKHFRASEKPALATARCVDCPHDATCPYSARKIYMSRVAEGRLGWPVDILTPDPDEESVLEALRTGPYGRCVYACDNDVVDNQVVNMRFESGATASLTMTAFTEAAHRQTRIFGTQGQLVSEGATIRHFDFQSDTWEEIHPDAADDSSLDGHGGGDYGIMKAFVEAVRHGDQARLLSGPDISLETHLMAFAAETSRLENRVVEMDEMWT